jgi:hypothetical protein
MSSMGFLAEKRNGKGQSVEERKGMNLVDDLTEDAAC